MICEKEITLLDCEDKPHTLLAYVSSVTSSTVEGHPYTQETLAVYANADIIIEPGWVYELDGQKYEAYKTKKVSNFCRQVAHFCGAAFAGCTMGVCDIYQARDPAGCDDITGADLKFSGIEYAVIPDAVSRNEARDSTFMNRLFRVYLKGLRLQTDFDFDWFIKLSDDQLVTVGEVVDLGLPCRVPYIVGEVGPWISLSSLAQSNLIEPNSQGSVW